MLRQLKSWWSSRKLHRLVAGMRSKYRAGRVNAVCALGDLGDSRAVEPLIAALKDEDSSVRFSAAIALGKLGDGRAAQPLIGAFSEHYHSLNQEIVEAVRKLRDIPIESLAKALCDKQTFVRSNIAELLGQIGDKRASQPLIAALRDEDSFVRQKAMEALARLRDPMATKPLAQMFVNGNRDVRTAALEALTALGWAPETPEERAFLAADQGDYDRAAAEGIAALRPLLAALRDPVLVKDSERSRKAGTSPSMYVLKAEARVKVVEALATLGDKQATTALLEAFEASEQPVWSAAMEALIQRRDEQVIKAMLTALQGGNAETRHRAAIALGKLGDLRAVEPLAAAATRSNETWYRDAERLAATQARWESTRALRELGDRRAIGLLLAGLNGADFDQKQRIVNAMELLGWEPETDEHCAALAAARLHVCVTTLMGRLANGSPSDSLAAAPELQRLLETQAPEMDLEVVRSLCNLPHVVEFRYICDIDYDGGSGAQYDVHRTDCTALCRLAQHELIRRGAEK